MLESDDSMRVCDLCNRTHDRQHVFSAEIKKKEFYSMIDLETPSYEGACIFLCRFCMLQIAGFSMKNRDIVMLPKRRAS